MFHTVFSDKWDELKDSIKEGWDSLVANIGSELSEVGVLFKKAYTMRKPKHRKRFKGCWVKQILIFLIVPITSATSIKFRLLPIHLKQSVGSYFQFRCHFVLSRRILL